MQPSPQADPRALIRRLSFDLPGLPPTPEEVKAFVEAQPRPADTYGSWSSGLLSSRTTASAWRSAGSMWSGSPTRSAITATILRRLARPRLGHPLLQRQQAFRPLHPRANRRRPPAPREHRGPVVGSAFNRLLLSTEEGVVQSKDYEARMLTPTASAPSGAAWLGQTTIGCCSATTTSSTRLTMQDFYSAGRVLRRHPRRPIIGRREDGMVVASAEEQETLSRGSTPPSPRCRNASRAVVPQLDVAQCSGRRTCPATPSSCPSSPVTRKATLGREGGRGPGPGGAEKDVMVRNPKEREAVQTYFRTRATPC